LFTAKIPQLHPLNPIKLIQLLTHEYYKPCEKTTIMKYQIDVNSQQMLKDDYIHQGKRRRLIQSLRDKKVAGESVLEAMMRVPRHLFVQDNAFIEHIYEDKAFPIEAGQTISHPSTVAKQTEILDIKKREKVLEIGTGSGYQTAVLCELGAKVFSIERQKELFNRTRPLLDKLNYKTKLVYGDGFLGLPQFAPFEKIIVTCGAPFVPDPLVNQLANGGIMVIPVGEDGHQTMYVLKKDRMGNITEEEVGLFRFVPMLEQKAK
jgi:protein-L-isoaspartate(D-aspartate) O-methyltransferase